VGRFKTDEHPSTQVTASRVNPMEVGGSPPRGCSRSIGAKGGTWRVGPATSPSTSIPIYAGVLFWPLERAGEILDA
jgi:hypothetical protein